jgi:hypothetical protein
MKDKYALLPQITLYVLLAIGIAISVLFYYGGSAGTLDVAGDALNIPRFTDLFLNWNYILLFLTLCVTIVVVCKTFINRFKVDRKGALKSLAIICLFVLVALICWFVGSPEKIDIIGYEGTDNEGAMAQLTDAMLYFTYLLLVGVVVAICWGYIYTRNKK